MLAPLLKVMLYSGLAEILESTSAVNRCLEIDYACLAQIHRKGSILLLILRMR